MIADQNLDHQKTLLEQLKAELCSDMPYFDVLSRIEEVLESSLKILGDAAFRAETVLVHTKLASNAILHEKLLHTIRIEMYSDDAESIADTVIVEDSDADGLPEDLEDE